MYLFMQLLLLLFHAFQHKCLNMVGCFVVECLKGIVHFEINF